MLQDALPREGLPYWTFWLLIFVIILLVTFIFLRDKDLRRRLNYLLSGGKRRLIRLQLQVRLKREKQRRLGFIKDIGKKAWSLDLQPAQSESIVKELRVLEDKRRSLQNEWQDVFARLETLHKKLEEFKDLNEREAAEEEGKKKPHEIRWRELKEKGKAVEKDIKAAEKGGTGTEAADVLEARLAGPRKDRDALTGEMDGVQKALEEMDNRIADIREKGRVQIRSLEAEIREWGKDKDRIQDRIRETERLMDPLYETLGAIVNEERPDNLELVGLYSKIDRLDKTIKDVAARIESLRNSSDTEFRGHTT